MGDAGCSRQSLILGRHASGYAEKLFDAIDGKRTIAEIAHQVGQRDTARVLFQGIKWYDQVAFDTSSQRRPP
jgi:hypothetical protein